MRAARPGRTQPAEVIRAPSVSPRRSRGRVLTLALLGSLVALNLAGLPYYLLPPGERLRSALHPWLKPTGYLGQSAGILAFLLFVFLWLYPLRKNLRWLAFTGSIGRWMDVHIVAGLSVPLLGAMHAAWQFEGLIGLGYLSMLVVSLSGIVGRYLYVHIPRSRSGIEMTMEEIDARRDALLGQMASATGIGAATLDAMLPRRPARGGKLGIFRTLTTLLAGDLARWRTARRFRRRLRGLDTMGRLDPVALAHVIRLAGRRLALEQQVRFLEATHRVFRYWHIAHRPVAITALLVVLAHVALMVFLGVTWLG